MIIFRFALLCFAWRFILLGGKADLEGGGWMI